MSEQGPQRRLSAILAADVVGYSRLMAADESGTLQRLTALRSEVIEPLLTKHRGRLVGSAGDSFLIEFASALSAVRCALEVQDAVAATNAEGPADRVMSFRVGINLGDVISEGGTIYGTGVNVAARLEKLSEAGGICVSASVYDQIKGRLPNGVRDLGERVLHGIPDPVRAYHIVVAGTLAPPESEAAKRGRERISIAILPFANMAEGKEQEYLADGLTEDLITALAHDGTLSVIARNSTFVYKGKAVKVQEVGRELGADFVVEGSVRQSGSRVRVTVQLIDCVTGAHAWARRFDHDLGDIFALQDEIVETVIANLNFGISDAAVRQRRSNPSASSSAFWHYLLARGAWLDGDEPATVRHLKQAITIDRNFALALAWLAFFHAYSTFSRALDLPDDELERLAREYAGRAVTADRSDIRAMCDVGLVYAMLGEHAVALPYTEAAYRKVPSDADVAMIHGWVVATSGQHELGLSIMQKSFRSQPRLPPGWQAALSDGRFLCGDYRGAAAAVAEIPGAPYYLRLHQASCLALAGEIEEARRLIRENAPAGFDFPAYVRAFVRCFAREDDRKRWLEGFRKAGGQI